MKENGKSLLWGVVVGGLIGSVSALLFAPKSGRELRGDIAAGTRQVTDKTQELAARVGEQGTQLIERVKDGAAGVVEDFQAWRQSTTCKDSKTEDLLAEVSSIETNELTEQQ